MTYVPEKSGHRLALWRKVDFRFLGHRPIIRLFSHKGSTNCKM